MKGARLVSMRAHGGDCMKFSSKAKNAACPYAKVPSYAVAAEAAGKKIYHLNIGQPDIETPPPVL